MALFLSSRELSQSNSCSQYLQIYEFASSIDYVLPGYGWWMEIQPSVGLNSKNDVLINSFAPTN